MTISRKTIILSILLFNLLGLKAQTVSNPSKTLEVHGTIRGKYEYQFEDKASRFQVRSARISMEGKLKEWVAYKVQIDLSDEGRIRMLDAYTKLSPLPKFEFRIGQMRVPFSIDAHRSPHQQYFANRSFIAKQVGNVRDVGATVAYTFQNSFPIKVEAGLFNGSGLTNQKDFWTKNINFSAKAMFMLPRGFNIALSTQKLKPDATTMMLYDAGLNYHSNRWHIELEYLYKHYAQKAFKDVHSVNAFINYDLPLKGKLFSKISPLLRYDFLSDHSDGIRYKDKKQDNTGSLIINDFQRHRITSGITLSIDKPFVSDIRINYENYFYKQNAQPKSSERDKIVFEVMTRF